MTKTTGALLAIVGLVLGFYWRHQSIQEQESAVALKNATGISVALRDSLVAARSAMVNTQGKTDTLWRVRTVNVLVADTFHHKADSIIMLAPPDSACTLVRQAYDARTSECTQLRVAIVMDSQAVRLLTTRLDTATHQLWDALSAIDDVNAQLKIAVKASGCHIVPFISCLSRKDSFIAGTLIGGFVLWRIIK